ncbi:MAG TPA: hypothetical protein DCY88_22710 [Cyanobacteria bacterium UBA11372]|nr:hypothetical protein [Cyanobacteria bacterium UBA11372]
MDALSKLELLKETYPARSEIDKILGKLLAISLSQYRLRLKRYEQDMREFDRRYEMNSENFYQRFEAGELGDEIDFFEWSSLYELRQDILNKIHQLELAV